MNKKQILLQVERSGGVVTTKEFLAMGGSNYYLKKLVEEGVLEKLKRGLFRLINTEFSEYSEVQKIIKKGIFCSFSAALIHGLSSFVPSEYHIAIPKKDKVRLPKYPPIKLYYWDKKQYTLGLEEIWKDGALIKIYDKEKTVCDFIKFRNKVGMDSTKEALKAYLALKDRNLDQLVNYAKTLKVFSILHQYLEVLV